MTDPMVAFVLARLDEDAAIARAVHGRFDDTPGTTWWNAGEVKTRLCDDQIHMSDAEHIAWQSPKRVLRGIAAKRLVITEAAYLHDRTLASVDEPFPMPDLGGRYEAAWAMLRALATEWDDHPDYLPEWKP